MSLEGLEEQTGHSETMQRLTMPEAIIPAEPESKCWRLCHQNSESIIHPEVGSCPQELEPQGSHKYCQQRGEQTDCHSHFPCCPIS